MSGIDSDITEQGIARASAEKFFYFFQNKKISVGPSPHGQRIRVGINVNPEAKIEPGVRHQASPPP
ncbi:MAG: hypothetical protein ACE5G3_04825 [Gammaproteobacteria bacterium]